MRHNVLQLGDGAKFGTGYFRLLIMFLRNENVKLPQILPYRQIAVIRRFYCRFRVSTTLRETLFNLTIMESFFLFRKSFWLSVIRFPLSIFSLDFQGWCLIGIILCSSIRIYHDRDFWFQIWEYILLKLAQ